MREVTGDEHDHILGIAQDSEEFEALRNFFEAEGSKVSTDEAVVIQAEERYVVTVPFDDGSPDTECEIVVTVHDGGVIGTSAGVDRVDGDEIVKHRWFEVDEQGRIHSGSIDETIGA